MQSTAIVQTIKSVQLNARYKRCCCFYWKRTASLETIVLLETVVLLNLILFFVWFYSWTMQSYFCVQNSLNLWLWKQRIVCFCRKLIRCLCNIGLLRECLFLWLKLYKRLIRSSLLSSTVSCLLLWIFNCEFCECLSVRCFCSYIDNVFDWVSAEVDTDLCLWSR